MRKKKSNFIRKIVIACLIVIGFMGSLVLIDKKYHLPSFFINDGVFFIGDLFGKSNNKLVMENKLLREENEKLKISINEVDELKEELKKLKDTLKLNSLISDKVVVSAGVVNRNLDYWYDTLNIDKGLKDGICKGMAVLSNGNLIGIIDNVFDHYSSVMLLTNNKIQNLSVKIKVNDNYVYGILNNYKDGFYEVMGIVENIDIKEDMVVVTSGLSSDIPSGIVVGSVSSVVTDNFDLSKIVKVKSDINFDDITYVSVVKGDV